MLYGTDSTMEKMVTADLGSQDSNDGCADGSSSLVATTILHPMVQDLAFAASSKDQNRVLKQAAAFNATIHTASTQQSTCLPIDRSLFPITRRRRRIRRACRSRLSTAVNADYICVIDKGAALEQGNHEELVAKGGISASMVEKQTKKKADLIDQEKDNSSEKVASDDINALLAES
jgi:hypothetical protein